MLNANGWGPQVAMAVQLRERGYLLEGPGRSVVERGPGAKERRSPRRRAALLRLVIAGLALLARAGFGDRA
jgi:hypothetical protein